MSKITLSIDWEDFGQLFGKYHHQIITNPTNSAIERQTDIILDMLDETGNKATFFILGILAKYRPGLVKNIASRGHEIGIHGQNHNVMYDLSRNDAKKDLEDVYNLVTDILGARVYGYRAPFFSINETNLYVLEILSELGFLYDSSIFPVKMPRYGIQGFNAKDALYTLANQKEIVELPLTVASFMGKKWPVSGGGYIRLMPSMLVKAIYNYFSKNDINSIIYMHPYEFDSQPIDVSTNYPSIYAVKTLKVHLLNFRWNLFRNTVSGKIKYLLQHHQFTTCLEKAINVKDIGISTKLLG